MNFGTPVPLLIGIILILGALALFFLDKFKPGFERDADKVYAVLLLISGLFLLAHLDMELLASFQQLLMAGMLTTLLIESVRNRVPLDPRERDPRLNRAPQPPRYDNRPPVQRGYRAELDDNRGPALRDRPMPPRMNPAQEAYWREESRPPYEERRGPAGRLQPSRQDGPPPNAHSNNEWYGERPPAARPPQGPPNGYPPQRGPQNSPQNGPQNGSGPNNGQPPVSPRPADMPPANRPSGPENGSVRPQPERPMNPGNGSAGRPSQSPSQSSSKGERTLNVRPLSEAPNLDEGYPS